MIFTLLSVALAIVGLVFAGWLKVSLQKQKIQNERIEKFSGLIRSGVASFLMKQFRLLAIFSAVIFLVLFFVPALSWKVGVAFLVGVLFLAICEFSVLKITTLANARVAEKFQDNENEAKRIAFSASAIIGLVVVGLGLLGVSVLYLVFNDSVIIFGFGFGASLAALFVRVGGGIFTKVADVGADLGGKAQSGLMEDDSRNPAVLADSVGDNVGDAAGLSADFFESYVNSLIAAMVFGAMLLPLFGSNALTLPIFLFGLGILVAVLGAFLIRFIKGNVESILNINVWLASLAMLIISFFAIKFLVSDIKVFYAFAPGLLAGLIICLITEYYSSEKNKPVQDLVLASQNGATINIISGLALGLKSVAVPVLAIGLAAYLANRFAGVYGLALASVGLLSILGSYLAAKIYGPIADNAESLARMAELGSEAKNGLAEFDASGNSASAVAKGLAISSTALVSLVLLFSFCSLANLSVLNLLNAKTLAGFLIGGALPFVFSALILKAVVKAAAKMAREVRRQLDEILAGEAEADYNKCLEIATTASLRQLVWPGLLAILSPVIFGFLLGPAGLAGLLAGAILTGFLLAVFMTSAGSAWDNAKKLIEAGNLGGRNDMALSAAIVGDTVGDPLKDTVGPALNIFLKLMAIVAIIIAPLLLL